VQRALPASLPATGARAMWESPGGPTYLIWKVRVLWPAGSVTGEESGAPRPARFDDESDPGARSPRGLAVRGHGFPTVASTPTVSLADSIESDVTAGPRRRSMP